MLRSRSRESEILERSEVLESRSWSRIFYLRLRNPERNADVPKISELFCMEETQINS